MSTEAWSKITQTHDLFKKIIAPLKEHLGINFGYMIVFNDGRYYQIIEDLACFRKTCYKFIESISYKEVDMIKKIKALLIVLLLINLNAEALEFKKEADKSKWIKEFFNGKTFDLSYAIDATESEQKFKSQLIKDFITQENIEHLEPIAIGNDINDPEIKKFNVACPSRKPINIYKRWRHSGSVETYTASEDELEDPKNQEYINQYSCTTNMKVFKFNVFNTKKNQENYILYCEDFRQDKYRKDKEIFELDIAGAYLLFDPNKCVYSDDIYSRGHPLLKSYVSGIFKYNGYYYFYSIETDDNKVDLEIYRQGNEFLPSKYYGQTIREAIK